MFTTVRKLTSKIKKGRSLRGSFKAYVLKKHAVRGVVFSHPLTVHTGRTHIPTGVACRLAEHLGQENLTEGETEVLRSVSGKW